MELVWALLWEGCVSLERTAHRKERKMSTITVRFNADSQDITLDQSAITLTNDVDYVIWEVQGLPPGASANIRFDGDGSGPFQRLLQYADRVIGIGNRGPGPTVKANFYRYHAELLPVAGESWSSAGLVINQATAAKRAATHSNDEGMVGCDPNTGGPPHCGGG